MKIIKKLCVYLLIGFLCSSSVFLSYEKANNCKAIGLVVEIGGAIILLGFAIYGAYYVSQPENQEELKEALGNYKDMTVEGAKASYEMNKKIFNDFIDYATSNGGGSAAVYTADGRSYSVNEMAAAGFPEFDDWDKEMKKQGSPSGGGFGSVWDKLSFGLELLDFVNDFFNTKYDDFDGNRLCYTGDSGYINRETGELDFSIEYYTHYSSASSKCDKYLCSFGQTNDISGPFRPYSDVSKLIAYEQVCRLALLCMDTRYLSDYSPRNYFCPSTEQALATHGWNVFRLYYTVVNTDGTLSLSCQDAYNSMAFCAYTTEEVYFSGNDCRNLYYLSTNLPVFFDFGEMENYLLWQSDTDDCVNNENPATSADVYCNYFNGKSVIPADVVNINYNISNNWDGTTENLTVILNGSNDNVTPAVTPTASPVPTLPDQDGSNTTNNYIINITNILQPIQETVTNIYNFFIIDTDTISEEINNINVSPIVKFEKVIQRVSTLKSAFSDEVVQSDSGIATADGVARGIYYPVIKMKCPSILLDYLDSDSLLEVDGAKYIVLVDFADWAVYFVRARFLLKVALWIGMFFYLLKQIRIVITIS